MKAKVAILYPRFIHTSQARAILGGRQVVDNCEAAGWLKPVRRHKGMTLFKYTDIQECADRIERGKWPEPSTPSKLLGRKDLGQSGCQPSQVMRTTTAPVEAGVVGSPEFVDVKGLRQMFGITRTIAYRLKNEGLIKSVSLREPGKLIGKRLFHVSSVSKYMNSLMEEQATGKASSEADFESVAAH